MSEFIKRFFVKVESHVMPIISNTNNVEYRSCRISLLWNMTDVLTILIRRYSSAGVWYGCRPDNFMKHI
jgi:hypothetical protein